MNENIPTENRTKERRMDPSHPNLHSVKLEVELLKKDVSQIESICGKLDTTIDKIQELVSTMTRMLSLHEQKLEKSEQNDKELFSLVELRRVELLSDIKELHSRVTSVSRELSDKIQHTENRLVEQMESMKKELLEHTNNKSDEIDETVESLSRWRWIIVGGAVVVGFLINSITQIAELFK